MNLKVPRNVRLAFQAARRARRNSYSPYSRFKVGAAIKLRGRETPVAGCNVENASFGATMCAERSALFRAVSEFGRVRPEFVVVVTGERQATVPCALCLQALAEFAADDMPVYLGNESGILRAIPFCDLLPQPFRSFKGRS